MATPIHVISSMATRQVLAELADACQAATGIAARIESVGGVDAAKRVRDGEAFDAAVLAADAIEQLIDAGRIAPGSRVDLVRSGVAVAVRAGSPRPDISSEDAVRGAVLAARTVGYSTGPSGVQLKKLFQHWGIADALAARLVQAPPGVPVGQLVAEGQVELGFQQLSELMHLPGITLLGTLPQAIQIVTVFSGGVTLAGRQTEAAQAVLAYMASAAAAPIKQRHGMEPA